MENIQILKYTDINENLKTLLTHKNNLITIYLDTSKVWSETEKAKIKLKNITSRIEEELSNREINALDVKKTLSPLNDLLENEVFWKDIGAGIALFLDGDKLMCFILKDSPEEAFYIGKNFNLKYLTQYIFEMETFYLLSLSHKEANLYEVRNGKIELLRGEGAFPDGVHGTWTLQKEPTIQHHTTKTIGKGKTGGMSFHGHGASKKGSEVLEKRYYEEIDSRLNDLIEDKNRNLILNCDESIFPIFKEISKYPNILDDYIKGSAKEKKEKLLKKTEEIIKKQREKRKENILSIYNDKFKQSVRGIVDVYLEARFQKIEYLLIGDKKDVWGNFDKRENKLTLHKSKKSNSSEIIGEIVYFTIKNNGEVYDYNKNDLGDKDIVATVRF